MQIPGNEVTQKDLETWYQLQDTLKKMRQQEMILRQKIFQHYFPEPKEGTNSAELPDGYVIKGKYGYSREIDVGELQALGEKFAGAGINAEALVQWKPSLRVREYKQMTAEQRSLFDQCLVIKPNSPTLEIVKGKSK